jgi:quinoprotein glucose dehydrogenase
MRVLCVIMLAGMPRMMAQTDWPVFGHDPGGMRYSPLTQINTKSVQQLKLVWTYDTQRANAPAPPTLAVAPSSSAGASEVASPRQPRVRRGESTPLVVGDVTYITNRARACDARVAFYR